VTKETATDTPDPAAIAAMMPLCATLGITISKAHPDEVRAAMDHSPERCTTFGVLHGGAIMALADTAGAVCASMHLPDGAGTATIESKTNFFRAVTDGHVEAISIPLHVGRSTIVVQTDVVRADGKPVTRTTQTQAVLDRA